MLKKLLLLAFALACLAGRAYAESDGYTTMVVEFTDGSEMEIPIQDQTIVKPCAYSWRWVEDVMDWIPTYMEVINSEDDNDNYFFTEPLKKCYFKFEMSYVESVAQNNVKLYIHENTINIQNIDSDVLVRVFTPSGLKIYDGLEHTINVPSTGVYMVSIGNQTYKVTVK